MIARFLRRIFSVDAIGLMLIVAALQALTYGLSSSLRGTDTRYFFWVCFVAVLIALGLSKLKLSGIQASAGMVALGVVAVWIVGARLTTPLLALGHAILSVSLQTLPQTMPSIRTHIPMDTTGIAETWLVVAQAASALSVRVQAWLLSLNENGTVNDALVRNMVWTLIIWLVAAGTGWFAGKRNAVAALLPSILLLAAVISYSGQRIYTLWLLVSVLLLLMGLWNFKNHTTQWEGKKMDYSDSIGFDVGQAVLFLTLIIGAITFVTPSISWREIRDFLRERDKASQNETADVLGIRQGPASANNAPAQKPALPRDHLLSGGFAQSEEIVMTIRTGELPPGANPALSDDAPRYYWRSTTYDAYVGAGWVTSAAPSQKYPPNTPLIPGLLSGYRTLHLHVNMVAPEGKLFWSGILFSADVPFTADWRVRPQSNLFADQATLLQADMFAALSDANAYRAESYIPLVTVEQLRSASTTYPEKISARYLSLPGSVPERVLGLAKEITMGKTTAYDKAKAIEAYLRTYPYDLGVPAPPEDRDVADYFLFDLKKGYCDYYATAMVVLARASGIPARFVSGYSPGSYDAANAQYVVRELNAHSWAEVYFPEIGWVEFEPTASQPEIDLVPSDAASLAAQEPDSTAARLLYRFRLAKATYWLSPVAAALVLAILYFTVFERWWYLRHLAPGTAIEKMYRRLYRLGRQLAGERTQAETAYEFMQKLVNKFDTLRVRERSRSRKLFVSAQQDVKLLTELYQATLFGQDNIQKKDVRVALKTWKHLRLRLLIARINVIASRAGRVPRSGVPGPGVKQPRNS